MINLLWFLVIALMLAGYAVLDGFDLGVGALHMFVARTPEERGTTIDAIGPVWNGNEVWLIAAGGALVVAFPTVYAASFSGFYLALMIVLWLLVLRGISIEFRHQVRSRMWHEAWDVTFAVSSALLALLFGVALANVLRGVPLDAGGNFQGSFALLLNPFALLGGLLAVATLAMHGACWLALKTDGVVRDRSRGFIAPLWWATMGLLVAMVAASFVVRADFTANFTRWPWLLLFPAIGVAAAALVRVFLARGDDIRTFLASAALIVGIITSVAAGLYPKLLPALAGAAHPGLDIYNAAAPAGSMRIALGIYVAGMVLVAIYLVNVYRIWRGKSAVYHP